VESPFRFAISASFTAEPLERVIAFWGRQLNSHFETRFAPYNQVLQTLLDPAGEFAANVHGINAVLLRLEDLAAFEQDRNGAPARLESNVSEVIELVRDASQRSSAPLVFCLCPPSPDFIAAPARATQSHELATRIAASLEDTPGVQFLGYEQVARLYPVEFPYDRQAERLGGIPYTELYFCALGTALVRHAHALYMPAYKVIALDCDNTLWQGICGEDGPRGVMLDPPRRALQEFMLDQRECGMLLALASKNNEQDVIETFAENPQMPLAMRHFAAWRLNWDSKPENLASLAEELRLGLDSFIFVDDNPKECAEVEEGAAEVLSLVLPGDITQTQHFLDHVWAFDHPVITEEDRNRNVYYAQEQEFGREIRRAANLAEFVAGLRLEVRMAPVTDERVGRVAQLTQRTNQFNFTTVRRTHAELQGLLRNGAAECVTVEASDRFGDYGVVGAVIFSCGSASLVVDTFLLSCRVLGRGVEHRILAWLGDEAVRRGLETVSVRLETTSKNRPAQEFLHSVGGAVEQRTGNGFAYEFSAPALHGQEWTPTVKGRPDPGAVRAVAPGKRRRFVEYARIAHSLSTPGQILEAVRREIVEAPAEDMTDIEQRLAVIWADLLQRPSVGVADNFFDLGGHSLLVVLLIVRVRESFGIELPIDDVYSASLSLGELARKIEVYQLAAIDPAEYNALLAEIESLSDEEVRRLLAEEERQSGRP
jgi:FkbH-like protein